MTGLYIVLGALAGLGLGIFIGNLVSKSKYAGAAAELKRLSQIETERAQLAAELEELKIRNAELKKEQEAFQEKLAWRKEEEERLRETFEALARRALLSNSEQFMNRSREQLEQLLHRMRGDWDTQKETFKSLVDPLKENLGKLDTEVRRIEEKREGAYQSLFKQVETLAQAEKELRSETHGLRNALRGDIRARGSWGEVQLRRIVEMAGLMNHVDFDEQVATADGGRPDMVVRLPQGGVIPVDAKAPMDAYLKAQEAEEESARRAALTEHARKMKGHVQTLTRRAYWEQFASSADFVVMLVPYEPGLSAAFEADPELYEYALDNKVLVTSPSTLLALLKVVAYGWMQLEISQNARAIAEQGRVLIDRFAGFLGHFQEVGGKLRASMESYDNAVGSAERMLFPAMRRMRELGAGTKDLPELEPIDLPVRRIDTNKYPGAEEAAEEVAAEVQTSLLDKE